MAAYLQHYVCSGITQQNINDEAHRKIHCINQTHLTKKTKKNDVHMTNPAANDTKIFLLVLKYFLTDSYVMPRPC